MAPCGGLIDEHHVRSLGWAHRYDPYMRHVQCGSPCPHRTTEKASNAVRGNYAYQLQVGPVHWIVKKSMTQTALSHRYSCPTCVPPASDLSHGIVSMTLLKWSYLILLYFCNINPIRRRCHWAWWSLNWCLLLSIQLNNASLSDVSSSKFGEAPSESGELLSCHCVTAAWILLRSCWKTDWSF